VIDEALIRRVGHVDRHQARFEGVGLLEYVSVRAPVHVAEPVRDASPVVDWRKKKRRLA
jgi:hypothetical protein